MSAHTKTKVYNENMSNKPSINIQSLTKTYKGMSLPSVDNLSLRVMPGEVYGFLGPNGAGKSTTIRTLMNFLQPTDGTAEILGLDIVSDSVSIKRHAGYLSGDFAIYPKMTGKQYIEYLNELQNGDGKQYAKEVEKRLQAVTDKPLGELSRGQRQKIGIIQAFMHKPKVLILDEPTSGLDPLMQDVFYDLVQEAKHRGAAVFMSSHIMGEVQKICDRVGIIREGKLISESSISELVNEAAQTFDVTFRNKAPITELKQITGLQVQNQKDNRVTFHMHGDLQILFGVLSRHPIDSIDTQTLDLEELFMHYYENGDKK